jgi:hypothetical protein
VEARGKRRNKVMKIKVDTQEEGGNRKAGGKRMG